MTDEDVESLKREIALLRAEVAKLKGRIDHVGKALVTEAKNTTPHFKAIYQYIADIHDYLTPLLHTVYPNYAGAKKQVDRFMEGYFSPPDSDSKKSS